MCGVLCEVLCELLCVVAQGQAGHCVHAPVLGLHDMAACRMLSALLARLQYGASIQVYTWSITRLALLASAMALRVPLPFLLQLLLDVLLGGAACRLCD